jgi:hypothetical protein
VSFGNPGHGKTHQQPFPGFASTFFLPGRGSRAGLTSAHFGAAWTQLRCACLNQQLQYRNSREQDMSDMLPMKSEGTNNI